MRQHNWNVRAEALPRNLITAPRAGFATARAQRYRSPSSSVHAKGRADEMQQLDDTTLWKCGNQQGIERVYSSPKCPQSSYIGAVLMPTNVTTGIE